MIPSICVYDPVKVCMLTVIGSGRNFSFEEGKSNLFICIGGRTFSDSISFSFWLFLENVWKKNVTVLLPLAHFYVLREKLLIRAT
jgi:hypothetical protein